MPAVYENIDECIRINSKPLAGYLNLAGYSIKQYNNNFKWIPIAHLGLKTFFYIFKDSKNEFLTLNWLLIFKHGLDIRLYSVKINS